MSTSPRTAKKPGAKRMPGDGPEARGAAAVAAGAAQSESDGSGQASVFERAMALFHSRNFTAAKALFEQAANGPAREMAHVSRLHARMCEHRIAGGAPQLATAEDRYNYAVALMNRRDLEAAEQQLKLAIEAAPRAGHMQYALALCRALTGDLQSAHRHLTRAIELEPNNRIAARNDPEFQPFIDQEPLRSLFV